MSEMSERALVSSLDLNPRALPEYMYPTGTSNDGQWQGLVRCNVNHVICLVSVAGYLPSNFVNEQEGLQLGCVPLLRCLAFLRFAVREMG